MNSCELVAAITAVAISIANCLNDEDLEIASVVFTQLGDTLSTISTKRGICKDICAKVTDKALPDNGAGETHALPYAPTPEEIGADSVLPILPE